MESSQPPQPQLLHLPGEVRNKIYKYALDTGSRGLYLLKGRGGPERVGDHTLRLGHNQLKYTCRQLYHETADVELKYNNVNFDSRTRYKWDERIPQAFDNLLTILANNSLSQKHVNLYSHPFECRRPSLSREDIDQTNVIDRFPYIDDICLQYPTITVNVIFSQLKPKKRCILSVVELIQNGLLLRSHFRDKSKNYIPSNVNHPWETRLALVNVATARARKHIPRNDWSSDYLMAWDIIVTLYSAHYTLQSPKLRLFPDVTPADFDESKFHEILSEAFCTSEFANGEESPLYQGYIEPREAITACVEFLKDWIENGI
jgi:hypothetical protein